MAAMDAFSKSEDSGESISANTNVLTYRRTNNIAIRIAKILVVFFIEIHSFLKIICYIIYEILPKYKLNRKQT